MWFSPQKERSSKHLVLRIISLSCLLHGALVALLFLSQFRSEQPLVLSGKMGAHVTMGRRAGKQGGSSQGSGAVAAQTEEVAVPVPLKSVEAPLPEKAPVKENAKPEVKKVPAVPEKRAKQVEKVIEKVAPPEPAVVPAFSELKKKFSTLKRSKPEEKKPEPQSAPVQAEPAKPQPKVQPQPPKQVEPPVAAQKSLVQETAKSEPTNSHPGSPGHYQQGGSYAGGAAETIELGDEGSGTGNDIVQEVHCHYRIPPGFEEHEPFTISFDIVDGKAAAISPRGNEPLALYAAIKDALVKSQFQRSKYVKRINLVIT